MNRFRTELMRLANAEASRQADDVSSRLSAAIAIHQDEIDRLTPEQRAKLLASLTQQAKVLAALHTRNRLVNQVSNQADRDELKRQYARSLETTRSVGALPSITRVELDALQRFMSQICSRAGDTRLAGFVGHSGDVVPVTKADESDVRRRIDNASSATAKAAIVAAFAKKHFGHK